MKKWICCLLTALFVVSFSGCQKEAPAQEGPAFYYCATDVSFSMGSKTILPECRSDAQSGTLESLLSLYLDGPTSEQLRSPFPNGLRVTDAYAENETLYIQLNDTFADLTGLELTMACSCLCLTGLAISDANTVVISAENSLLDGQKSITMNVDTLLLLDTVLEGE